MNIADLHHQSIDSNGDRWRIRPMYCLQLDKKKSGLLLNPLAMEKGGYSIQNSHFPWFFVGLPEASSPQIAGIAPRQLRWVLLMVHRPGQRMETDIETRSLWPFHG